MIKQDFAFRINKIHQLLGGMRARMEEMALWGYPAEFINTLAAYYTELVRLQDERNANKAAGRAATARQRQTLRAAEKMATMVRQSIRSRLPKADWNQFGFYAGEYSAAKPKEAAEPEREGA